MEDNRLHSNVKVRHGNQRGGFQQSQPTRLLKLTAGSDVLRFRAKFLLLQLKCDLLGDQDHAY
jgi:hypothetical protein